MQSRLHLYFIVYIYIILRINDDAHCPFYCILHCTHIEHLDTFLY